MSTIKSNVQDTHKAPGSAFPWLLLLDAPFRAWNLSSKADHGWALYLGLSIGVLLIFIFFAFFDRKKAKSAGFEYPDFTWLVITPVFLWKYENYTSRRHTFSIIWVLLYVIGLFYF
ncbi:TPA: hypothetical protein JG832_002426 [Enterobacter hormaechei subsp. xiangfangensis]|nr:hypothetical protein [Enterobacter hormaechei subsp. xiangfangensis]HAV1890562.1 hypothetical protein [Enterobacter hormaechei subsp. xiangfangensis]